MMRFVEVSGLRLLILMMGLGGVTLSSCPADAKDATEIVLGVPAGLSLSYSMLTAAMDLGYFEQEGLKLTIQQFQGGASVMPQVGTKAILIGASAGDPLVVANQPGKQPIPIKFFYDQVRGYNWEWVVPPNSPIRSITDLKGKKIGVGSMTNAHMPVSRVILKDNGLTETKDYTFLPVGVGGPAFRALLDGQIDVYNTFTANISAFEALPNSVKLRHLPTGDRYESIFQTSFFAHEDTIKQHPDVLIGFGRATAKATIFCRTAMKYCIKSFWRHYPNVRPREGSEDDNAERLIPSMEDNWKIYFIFRDGQPRRFGAFPRESWDNLMAVLAEGGAIAHTYDPSRLYTNALVDKINDFDAAAIEKQAADLK